MKRVLKFIFIKLPLALIALSIIWVLALKVLPPAGTPLMIRRSIQFSEDKDFHTRYKWVKLENISPNLMKAVLSSEDNLFPKHNGFAVGEIKKMLKEHQEKGKKIRGCSTISQQTAKNVFTSGKHSWIRKGVEAWYTVLIELIWGKRRIMEVYLNVVEMGPGIYGAQAAAQHYWHKNAKDLTMGESALLAACLPDPLNRKPTRVTRYLGKRQAQIISLSRKLSYPDWVKDPSSK